VAAAKCTPCDAPPQPACAGSSSVVAYAGSSRVVAVRSYAHGAGYQSVRASVGYVVGEGRCCALRDAHSHAHVGSGAASGVLRAGRARPAARDLVGPGPGGEARAQPGPRKHLPGGEDPEARHRLRGSWAPGHDRTARRTGQRRGRNGTCGRVGASWTHRSCKRT
jgi:hypothetical protein